MATGVQWQNGGDRSTVDIQPNGPGNKWYVLDQNAALDAASGGGRARQTNWGRGERGGLQPRSLTFTGNPDDYTFNLTYPLTSENALKRLTCPFSVRVRQYCSPNRTNMVGYAAPGMKNFLDATATGFSTDNPLAVMDGQANDVMSSIPVTASLAEFWVPTAHDDISGTTADVAINRVINIGAEICSGACGQAATEEDAWLAVTDKDASPAYGGGSAPWLYWTVDRWVTRTGVRIGTYIGADALDVVLAGSKVLVFSDTKAPIYAELKDIYNGVADPNLWATASGLSAITGSNFPKAAVAIDSSTILAVGAGGRIWLSTDGGVTYTLIYDTGVLTSNNLNAIHGFDGGNAYAGGNSGTFIRLIKTPGTQQYTGSLIVVKDASLNILSSNINSVRCPPDRGDEVFLGTAGGEIWRSKNVNATVVVFKNKSFPKSGVGAIRDMNFAGLHGSTLFVVQADTSGYCRILRDFSGGNLETDVEVIGDFVSPGNFAMNSFAPANINMGIAGGEVHGTYAFIGMVRQT